MSILSGNLQQILNELINEGHENKQNKNRLGNR